MTRVTFDVTAERFHGDLDEKKGRELFHDSPIVNLFPNIRIFQNKLHQLG